MDIVNNIIQLSKEKGVKQSFLEKLIGGHRGKITDWKSGRSTPTEEEVKIIAEYFNVSVDELLGKTDNQTQSSEKELNEYRFINTANYISMAVSENIKMARKEAGLTQQEFAERINISNIEVEQYENGNSLPKVNVLQRMADMLHADIRILVYGLEEIENDVGLYLDVAALSHGVEVLSLSLNIKDSKQIRSEMDEDTGAFNAEKIYNTIRILKTFPYVELERIAEPINRIRQALDKLRYRGVDDEEPKSKTGTDNK